MVVFHIPSVPPRLPGCHPLYKQALKDFNRAIAAFDKVLQLSPHNVAAYIGKGIALLELSYHQEALNYFDKALEVVPNDPYLWYYKSSALASLGRSIEAQLAYKRGEHLFQSQSTSPPVI